MSLTRQEWQMIWMNLQEIERNAKALDNVNKLRQVNILREVDSIKNQVQKVIGQME